METGESVTIIRSEGYTIHTIRPCTMEKGKKMAKLTFKSPPSDVLKRLEKGKFDEIKLFPELGTAKIRLGGKHILVFASGEVTIRAADDREDIIETAEMLVRLLS